MAPPVCAACGTILSGTCYFEEPSFLCASCGARRQDGFGRRRIVRAIVVETVGSAIGIGVVLATGSWLGLLGVAVGGAIAIVWRPPAVEGPRPVGNPMPPADVGGV